MSKEVVVKVCKNCTRQMVPYGKDKDLFACLRCDKG